MAVKEKVDKFMKKAAVWAIIATVALLILYPKYKAWEKKWEEEKEKRQKAEAVATAICATDYDFTHAQVPGSATVQFREDCSTRVILPPFVTARTHPSTEVYVNFIDGSKYKDGPKETVLYGLKKGVFHIRGITSPGTMEVFWEKRT